jgi:geranylgeranyl diphosphate synthase type II
MTAVTEYLQSQKDLIEAKLATILKPYPEPAARVFQAMDYSLLAGGKRLRPILFLTVLRAFHKKAEDYLPFACGLEMIHTYSLIHDDLPAMDDDDLRRGHLTNHKVFGEDFAILAGDGLLTHSFFVMLSLRKTLPVADLALLLAAVEKVSLAAGLQGMLTGQAVDVAAEGKDLSLAELQYIHKYKTGALFGASVIAAAILADAKPEEISLLEEYVENFGVAFQIIDDILDVVGDEAKLGKPVGSDEKNHKTTYPSILGLEESRKAAISATARATDALSKLGGDFKLLSDITNHILNRDF